MWAWSHLWNFVQICVCFRSVKSVIMSHFLMWLAFHQFRKNWKNQLNFKDTVVHGWGSWFSKNRGKQREPLWPIVQCKSILYLHRREPCNYYMRALSMNKIFSYYYVPGSFPMGFHNFSCYDPMQARPDLDLPGPRGILASAQNQSISSTSTSSNSSNSPSGNRFDLQKCQQCAECWSDGRTYSSDKEKTVQQMDKWGTKALIYLWMERKRKCKRARAEEGNEEGDLIKSSLLGMEKQWNEMNAFMETFARVQKQQVNKMNVLHVVGALTNFLENSSNNNKWLKQWIWDNLLQRQRSITVPSLKCISMYIQMLPCRFRWICFKKYDHWLISECLDIKFCYNCRLNTYIYIIFQFIMLS